MKLIHFLRETAKEKIDGAAWRNTITGAISSPMDVHVDLYFNHAELKNLGIQPEDDSEDISDKIYNLIDAGILQDGFLTNSGRFLTRDEATKAVSFKADWNRDWLDSHDLLDGKYSEIHETRLDEITRPETLKEVGEILSRAGYAQIGSGWYSRVFVKPGADHVLKLFTARDRCYIDYLKFCAANQSNPHVPRIKGKPMRLNDRYWAVRLEKLEPMDAKRGEEWANRIQNVVEAWLERDYQGKDRISPIDQNRAMKLQREFPHLFALIDEMYGVGIFEPGVAETECSPDIWAANLMQRPDQTMVLIDPTSLSTLDRPVLESTTAIPTGILYHGTTTEAALGHLYQSPTESEGYTAIGFWYQPATGQHFEVNWGWDQGHEDGDHHYNVAIKNLKSFGFSKREAMEFSSSDELIAAALKNGWTRIHVNSNRDGAGHISVEALNYKIAASALAWVRTHFQFPQTEVAYIETINGDQATLNGPRQINLFIKNGVPPRKIAETTPEDDHAETLAQTGYWGRAGAGCLIMARDTGRILLPMRSAHVEQPHTWGTWGGAIDQGEDPKEAVRREVQEEAGFHGALLDIYPLYVFKNKDFRYYNFLALVDHEFQPRLNWETQQAEWFEFGDWPHPLHFGLRSVLLDGQSQAVLHKALEGTGA